MTHRTRFDPAESGYATFGDVRSEYNDAYRLARAAKTYAIFFGKCKRASIHHSIATRAWASFKERNATTRNRWIIRRWQRRVALEEEQQQTRRPLFHDMCEAELRYRILTTMHDELLHAYRQLKSECEGE